MFDTLKYDHAVTGLQFDSRKIVAATGENAVKVSEALFVVLRHPAHYFLDLQPHNDAALLAVHKRPH